MKTFLCRFLVDPAGKVWNMSRDRNYFSLIFLSLMFFLFQFSASVATAQTTTSTIEGTVTDPNGAVIAGAIVKASGTTLAIERSATTDADGTYRLIALPAGTYTLTVSQTGFSAFTSTIELTLNRVAKFDIQMQVGNAVADVNVTDELPLLEVEASSTGATVTPRQIQDFRSTGVNTLTCFSSCPELPSTGKHQRATTRTPCLESEAATTTF